MKQKSAVMLLYMLILIASLISSLPPTVAVPSSRSLKSIYSVQNASNDEGVYEGKKERMVIQVEDYSGTGANNHHDPRSPPASY